MADRSGIEIRHQSGCASLAGKRCDCDPTFRASVYHRRTKRTLKRSFTTEAAARRWRDPRPRRHPTRALDGVGADHRPGRRRGADRGHARRIGAHALGRSVQAGVAPSTSRNAIMPLRVMCRRARGRSQIPFNPVDGVELPAVRGRRDRVADPVEAAALLDALEPHDRAIWATAMYAGLRLGELQALHVEDVDLDRRVIEVRRGWDPYEGEQTPKSRSGERKVPIVAILRPELDGFSRNPGHYGTRRTNPARTARAPSSRVGPCRMMRPSEALPRRVAARFSPHEGRITAGLPWEAAVKGRARARARGR
jgi:integrase